MTTSTTQQAAQPPVREPLGRPFGIHLGGVGLANLADGIVIGAVPLIAVTLTRSPAEISLIQTAFWLPWLLLGVVAGMVVDRFDRRHIQLSGAAVRVVLMAGMTVVAVTDQLSMPLLIAAVGIYGITQVFVDLAGSSIVPQLAPRSRLSAANGRVMGMEQVMNTFLGAPLGGFILVLGSGWVFGLPVALGVTFLLLIGFGLRGNYRADTSQEPASSRLRGMAEGVRFQLWHPVLRPLLINGSVLNFANTAYFAVFVLWVVGPESAVQLAPQQFPVLLAVLAVGAVTGSVLAERLVTIVGEVPLILTAGLVNSALLLVPVLWPNPWVIGAAFFVIGFTNMCGNVVRRSISQRLIPTAKLGRVGGASGMINYGLMPLGALLGGVVAEAWGLSTLFYGAVVLMLVSGVWVCTQVSTRLVRAHEVG